MEKNLVWKLISYIFQLYESYEIKFPTKISSFTVASNCVRLLIKCGFYTRLKTNIKIILTTHAQCKHYNFFKAYLLWCCPVQLCIHTTISWSLTGPHSLTFFIIFLQRSRDPRQYVKGDSESQTLSAMPAGSIECNRPFAQLLPGLETGHPVTVGQSPAYDFSVFDEQKAVFLVSVSDCSGCDSCAGD